MIISDAGRRIIETFEGFRLTAYRDLRGRITIGFGHTGDVKDGDVITKHQAEVILEHDLDHFETAVAKLAPQANANQFSALVCLAFNIGVTALATSRLLRKFTNGDIQGCADEFASWTHVKGKEEPGLVRRRAAERALFLQIPS